MKTKIVQIFGTDARIDMYEAKKVQITIGENWQPTSWYPTIYPVPNISFNFNGYDFVYIDLNLKYNQKIGWHPSYTPVIVCAEKDTTGNWNPVKPDDNTKGAVAKTFIDVLKKEMTIQDILEAEESKFRERLKWASFDVAKHKTRMDKALEIEAKMNKRWTEAQDKLQKYLAHSVKSPIPQNVAPPQTSNP